ncbi:MAG: putative nucleic acid-binding protein, contains PIN domain protein [uncultured archaeon A07HN63]|nr:MAG: putative nucleic acid-binding protein, contains PIN domain protein [uncultured archaeon A07HN63]
MLLLDNTILSDYLAGVDTARQFLEEYEQDVWAVSAIALYEAYMGCAHGYIDATPAMVRQAINTSMTVVDVTQQTAAEAETLQQELLDLGVPADSPDVLIAATAREHGGTFATADKHFWKPEIESVLSVAQYDPY